MATFFFRKAVNDWKAEGIDFSMYMYVPEVDPITQAAHHERSDHCHILKRIAGLWIDTLSLYTYAWIYLVHTLNIYIVIYL